MVKDFTRYYETLSGYSSADTEDDLKENNSAIGNSFNIKKNSLEIKASETQISEEKKESGVDYWTQFFGYPKI